MPVATRAGHATAAPPISVMNSAASCRACLPRAGADRFIREWTAVLAADKLAVDLCGHPRRWITSAGLSPVALAQQMTPKYYTYCFHRPELFLLRLSLTIGRDELPEGA